MSNLRSILSVAALMLTTFTALAQPAQTFVSAKTGNDGNPCTLVLPCRSLATAHSLVASGGQILVIDSGDYATLNITKAVTVEAAPGVSAVLLNPVAGGSIISINAGSADKVTLRSLHLKSGAPVNNFGVGFSVGASLLVDNCVIEGFATAGINAVAAGSVTVQNSSLRNNGAGVYLGPTSGTQTALIDNCLIEKSTVQGINVAPSNNVSVRVVTRNSRVVNGGGSGLRGIVSPTNSTLDWLVENVVVLGNNSGIYSERSGSVIRVANSTVVNNATGILAANAGSLLTRGNNTVEGNTTNGTFTGTFTAK